MLFFARPEHLPLTAWLMSVKNAPLGRVALLNRHEQETVTFAAVDTDRKSRVGLLVHQLRSVQAELVAINLVSAQSFGTLARVEQSFVIGGPNEIRSHSVDFVGKLAASGQIQKANLVNAPADSID